MSRSILSPSPHVKAGTHPGRLKNLDGLLCAPLHRRGNASAVVRATLGVSVLRVQDGHGETKVERVDRDFIIAKEDLRFADSSSSNFDRLVLVNARGLLRMACG